MRDDHLDELIDATARTLSAGEPPARLRRRVRQQIDRRGSRDRRLWRPLAAVAAGVAAGVWLSFARPAPQPGPVAPASPAAVTQPAGPAAAAAAGQGHPVAPVPAVAAPRRERVTAAARQPVEASDLLPVPPPIVVSTVSIGLLPELSTDEPMPLEIPLLEVPMPLQAERLEIEPLTLE